jgi:hypothetical protein
MNQAKSAPRTYNQTHITRKYSAGRRRVSVYISWSYPGEANRDITEMDNRFSTMTEVRRVLWPAFETPQFADPLMFQQGIAGSLELFFLAWVRFQEVVREATGHPVAIYQRVDQAGVKLPLDDRVLADTDTLLVFGLDHMVTQQEASADEIGAVRQFLAREGTCLIIGPHHEVGVSDDPAVRAMEYAHHGDALVPRQQRFGRFTRSLLKGLDIPVENRYGLLPARDRASGQIAPLSIARDLDTHGWLAGVTSFNFHRHLPHYALTTGDTGSIHILARQPIDQSKPHPFTEAGNREFNMLVWIPPSGSRVGDVLLADSTIFSTLFGGTESLENFWRNIARG